MMADLDFSDLVSVDHDPANNLQLNWVLIGVDRQGEGLILDASPDFYAADLITELFACDNGIVIPTGTKPGLYVLRDIRVIGGVDDCDIKGNLVPLSIPEFSA